MGNRNESLSAHAGESSRDAEDRTRIADMAARLIAEHGIADWSLAKRKAVRHLMLPERTALPGDDEIEAALAVHHSLFGGEAHDATLRQQREEALTWLRELADFSPVLVGGVAAGWATEYSDIRIELIADDSKEVELMLINHSIPYRVAPGHDQPGSTELLVDTRRGGVALVVRTPAIARQRPRRDRRGNGDEVRLSAAALAELLAADANLT
ncbi:MAG TPA: UDP-N-acetylmuramate--alanine ligase [Casimicrobiaceae bacterium]|nr:UDP-N-acetylmuramate--alanine ligase [Casimicrobiaceae bacterium]